MKNKKFPDTYLIIFFIIILCAVATWFVPGGEYVTLADGTVAFNQVPHQPQTWQVFSSLLRGFGKQSEIIVFVLVIGGAFWIVNGSKAIDAGIHAFLKWATKLERYRFLKKIGVNNVIMTLIMLLFSTFGAVFGMSEECIAFVIILVPLAISMGYDSIVGVCLVYVAAHVGFSGAFLNPFTVGIAQDLAGLPLFSGIEYRFICWCVLNILLVTFVLIYASRIKKNPQSSIMYRADESWRAQVAQSTQQITYYRNKSSIVSFVLCLVAIVLFTVIYRKDCDVTLGARTFNVPWLLPLVAILFTAFSIVALRRSVHFYVLNLLCFTIVYLIIGVLGFQWYLPEISGLFLALAIASGIAVGMSGNQIVKEFLSGTKDILGAAMVIGLAAGIIIIFQDGKIMDTLLHSLAGALGESGKVAALSVMYGIQTLINLVIPSATAKAAITMPIMAPFADIIGLSRQATVLAFQFGDGFTNMITPTSGVLIAVLGLARIPYAVWAKWVWKFIVGIIVLGLLLLLPTVLYSIPGF